MHLGQSLRTDSGWRIIDFEGEPTAPLAVRRELDSPWRDVAGMLRSMDYAPWSVAMQVGIEDRLWGPRAAAWTDRNCRAFLEGYGGNASGLDYRLLRCYQIDKAAYEVDYERAHRPRWAAIPELAMHRLLQ